MLLMNEAKTIKDWSADERPREKMLQKGMSALSDAELLAILISSGTKKRTALDLAREALDLVGKNLRELGRLDVKELQKIKGIGQARAVTICAALELGRRRQLNELPEKLAITTSRQAANLVMPHLQDLNHEVFYVLYLNQSCRLIREEKISSGGLTATVADTRMILKNSLLHNANNIIVAHNHPSGNKTPSQADIKLTQKIKESAALMDIKLVDHLIIAGNEYLSMADEGYV
jgi:DNA repair protein RadC